MNSTVSTPTLSSTPKQTYNIALSTPRVIDTEEVAEDSDFAEQGSSSNSSFHSVTEYSPGIFSTSGLGARLPVFSNAGPVLKAAMISAIISAPSSAVARPYTLKESPKVVESTLTRVDMAERFTVASDRGVTEASQQPAGISNIMEHAQQLINQIQDFQRNGQATLEICSPRSPEYWALVDRAVVSLEEIANEDADEWADRLAADLAEFTD